MTTKEARNRWYHNGGKHSQMLSNKRMLLRNRLAWAYIKENLPHIALDITEETNKQTNALIKEINKQTGDK